MPLRADRSGRSRRGAPGRDRRLRRKFAISDVQRGELAGARAGCRGSGAWVRALGITVTGLIVGFLAEPSVSAPLRPALNGTGLPDGPVSAISVTLAFVMATVVQTALGELGPQTLTIAVPDRLAKSLGTGRVGPPRVDGRELTAARRPTPIEENKARPIARVVAPRRLQGKDTAGVARQRMLFRFVVDVSYRRGRTDGAGERTGQVQHGCFNWTEATLRATCCAGLT